MIVQRQGKQERITFRSVPKEDTAGWVWSIHLHGPEELKVFKQILGKFREMVDLSKKGPVAKRKLRLGKTSQHEFWLSVYDQDVVIDFTDQKNANNGGVSMLGQDTIAQFMLLSAEYDAVSQLFDYLRDEKAKHPTAPEQASRGRSEGRPTTGSYTRSSSRGGNARTPSQEQVKHSRTKPQIAAPPSGKSAAYRREWQETYEGGKRWSEIHRSAASSQPDHPLVAALRSTLSSLETIPVELRSEGWKEAYDLEKSRLEGFLAGLNE